MDVHRLLPLSPFLWQFFTNYTTVVKEKWGFAANSHFVFPNWMETSLYKFIPIVFHWAMLWIQELGPNSLLGGMAFCIDS